MSIEKTLSIVKPDGVRKNLIGECFRKFEKSGLKIIASKMIWMDERVAAGFYAVHKERSFFKDLMKFMTSGPCVISVLEGENAIAKNREIMGATDPAKAAAGTIRKEFADNIEQNIVHGSDAPETARFEIGYFFQGMEIFSR